jgi:hypothetical protein
MELVSYFFFLQEQMKDIIIIIFSFIQSPKKQEKHFLLKTSKTQESTPAWGSNDSKACDNAKDISSRKNHHHHLAEHRFPSLITT